MVDPDSVTELTNILIKKDDEISQLKAQVTSLTKENESLVYVNRQEVEEKIAPFKVVWEKEIEELKAQVEGLVGALNSCRLMANREYKKDPEMWGHIRRFCKEVGVEDNLLRSTLPSQYLEIAKAKDAKK